jgi:hypothetical protein
MQNHSCFNQEQNKIYLNEEVADPAKTVGDTRLILAKPVVVRDADVVNILKKVGVFALDLKKISHDDH